MYKINRKMIGIIITGMFTAAVLMGCGKGNDVVQDTETQPVKESVEADEALEVEADQEPEEVIPPEEEKKVNSEVEANDEVEEPSEEASQESDDGDLDDQIYQQFIDDEIAVDGRYFSEIYSETIEYSEEESPVMFYYDVDEDDKKELIVSTVFYGYDIYDIRNGDLLLLDCGNGTGDVCGLYKGNGHVYVGHGSFSHAGWQGLMLTRYDGDGNIVEEISIDAVYEDADWYDENSDFTYNNQKITMQEYEDYMNSYEFIDRDSAITVTGGINSLR